VATNPDFHPLDDEILDMYAANPGLERELNELEARIERGEEPLIDDAVVRERLKALGVPLDDEES
jgi:hypothetical protein